MNLLSRNPGTTPAHVIQMNSFVQIKDNYFGRILYVRFGKQTATAARIVTYHGKHNY